MKRRTVMIKERWVVKVGSRMVCQGGALLVRAWMQQVLNLKKQFDVEVIWVTSGAIASAVERTSFKKSKTEWTLAEKQALSAIGQPLLMDLYNLALGATGLLGAQVLLTYYDLIEIKRRQNFQNTIEQLLRWNTLPLLNENDAIATDEIKFGDNDSLSAKVAHFTKSDRLIILTDVDGLYDMNPQSHPEATLIKSLSGVSSKLISQLASAAGSKMGTGGMYSKIKAAREATLHGIPTTLVKGDQAGVLLDLANGKACGTLIAPKRKKK